jgi:hypothetical protein
MQIAVLVAPSASKSPIMQIAFSQFLLTHCSGVIFLFEFVFEQRQLPLYSGIVDPILAAIEGQLD